MFFFNLIEMSNNLLVSVLFNLQNKKKRLFIQKIRLQNPLKTKKKIQEKY